jgi:uncharacterized repeat protein (TIGR03803 family)
MRADKYEFCQMIPSINRRCFVLVFVIGSTLVWQASAQTFKPLHVFGAATWRNGLGAVNNDGANPDGLTLSEQTIYGTTENGGKNGKGTVFKVMSDGSGFVTLHDFSASDGAFPEGSLTLAGNILYGTTRAGGNSITSNGTIFAVNTEGTGFRTVHNFTGGRDGAAPNSGVIVVSNTLYGTAYAGGNFANNYSKYDIGNGTLFAVNTDGTDFRTLHAFNGTNDGMRPACQMVLSGTTMYGTTEQQGGGNNAGTVFKINLDGTGYTTLHRFTRPIGTFLSWTNVEGIYLDSGLLLSGGTLYGTANTGGKWNKGTVFAIKVDGSDFTVLHSFNGAYDGGGPLALVELRDRLYGTADHGGIAGKGTIFSIGKDGTGFKNVYTFKGEIDGAKPVSPLVLSGNVLYGIAYRGSLGPTETRGGTVFSLDLEQ